MTLLTRLDGLLQVASAGPVAPARPRPGKSAAARLTSRSIQSVTAEPPVARVDRSPNG